MVRLVAWSLLGLALVSGCNPNPFCLNCNQRDAAADAAAPDLSPRPDLAAPPDLVGDASCVPTNNGVEICDGIDNNCDGIIDNVDPAKLAMDPNHCGKCFNACIYPNAYGVCMNGACSMGGCQPGHWDLNHNPADGCEYACIPNPAPKTCRAASDCPMGVACSNGYCGKPCQADADCPMFQACDTQNSKVCLGELCDGIDNNCNGKTDEGFDLQNDVGNCGTCENACTFPNATGKCAAAACTILACTPGFYDLNHNPGDGCEYACRDANGMPITTPMPEKCNGVDDNCNGVIDDNPIDVGVACDDFCPPLAACVANNSCMFRLSACAGKCCGICTEGATICAGGQKVCQMGQGPMLEVCDGVDNNCDGQIDEGFDLQNDPVNCGACNKQCSLPNAVAGCAKGKCTVVACKSGFADLDKSPANGCEYTCPVNPPTVEVCNGKDDDCNGLTDDNLTPPPNFCVQTGPCAGARPLCMGAAGWLCNYRQVNPRIEVDAMGNLVFSETLCDGIDGNCNGLTDESFTNLGKSCTVGIGTCQGTATFICDPNNARQTACPAVANAMAAVDEKCNGIDDDCDGQIDERTPAAGARCYNGAAHNCLGWQDPMVRVTVNGAGVWVYQYEASRPDATAAAAGTSSGRACANAGVLPWAPVTWGAAVAACAQVLDSSGAPMRLCTETEWQTACAVGVAPPTAVWSYAANPTTYQAMTCNGSDAGRTGAWATGSGAQCYANQASGKIYDLSGNVSEWTSTQVTYMTNTYYRVRGGAFNNFAMGTSCNFDFVIEQPTYQYVDVGFRCCADNAP